MTALFPHFYDEACLEGLGGLPDGQTALEVARLFFDHHSSTLRVDTTAFSAWAFAAVVAITLAGRVPIPSTRASSCLFLLWVFVQLTQILLYALAVAMEAMAFLSARGLTAPCARHWKGKGVQSLDMLTALTLPFQGSLVHKLLAVQASLMCLLSGLYVVDAAETDSCSTLLRRAAIWLRKGTHAAKVALDVFGGALLCLGASAWVVTAAFVFSVVLVPLPIATLLAATLGLCALRAAGAGLARCCPRASSVSNEAVDWIKSPIGSKKVHREFCRVVRGKRVMETVEESRLTWVLREDPRLHIGAFACLAIAVICVSPLVVTSTWLAWTVYEGHALDSSMAAMKDIYDASIRALADGLRPPPLADMLALANLDSLMELLASLHEFVDVNPVVLLTGSRVVCALSVLLSTLRVVILSIAKTVDIATQSGAVDVAPVAVDVNEWSREWVPSMTYDCAGSVRVVAFSPDGEVLALAGRDCKITLRSKGERGAFRETLAAHDCGGAVLAVAFSPAGEFLAHGGLGGKVSLRSRGERGDYGEVLVAFDGGESVQALAYSPDGQRLAHGGADGKVTLRSRGEQGDFREVLATFECGKTVWAAAFSPSGQRLAHGGGDSAVTLRSEGARGDFEEMLAALYCEEKVFAVAFSPDGEHLAHVGNDGKVTLRSRGALGDFREILAAFGCGAVVWAVTFSPDGQLLAHGGNDKKVTLRSRGARGDFREILATFDCQDWVEAVAFSPDGRRLAYGGFDGKVTLRKFAAPREAAPGDGDPAAAPLVPRAGGGEAWRPTGRRQR